MILHDDEIQSGEEWATYCNRCPARRSNGCCLQGEPPSWTLLAQAIAHLKIEFEAMESFYAKFGMPQEKHAKPHLLRIVTAMKRDLIEVKRRLLELKDSCDAWKHSAERQAASDLPKAQ